MKKTIIAMALGSVAVSGTAFSAEEVNTTVYGGAELGGDFLLDDQTDMNGEEQTFDWGNKVFLGAEMGKDFHPEVRGFVQAEAEYTFGEYDEDVIRGGDAEVRIFAIGADTKAGRTTLGIQKGIADDFDGFADLSMEHGLNADGFLAAADKDEMLQHVFKNENVELGASYDFETEAYALTAATHFNNLQLGMGYVDGGDIESGDAGEEGVDVQSFTFGAVYTLNEQISVAGKYVGEEGDDIAENSAYGLSGTFALNSKVKFAGSYNSVDFDDSALEDDDFFTLGASYQVNDNVELVTDYKFASEEDDKLFVRANINF